jgi:hypothetical protein
VVQFGRSICGRREVVALLLNKKGAHFEYDFYTLIEVRMELNILNTKKLYDFLFYVIDLVSVVWLPKHLSLCLSKFKNTKMALISYTTGITSKWFPFATSRMYAIWNLDIS